MPGTQPQHVNRKTMSMEPQPLSNTANGGNIIDKMTLNNDMTIRFLFCKYNKRQKAKCLERKDFFLMLWHLNTEIIRTMILIVLAEKKYLYNLKLLLYKSIFFITFASIFLK